jgi:hypothetical protein
VNDSFYTNGKKFVGRRFEPFERLEPFGRFDGLESV